MTRLSRKDMKVVERYIINQDKLRLRLGMREQELLTKGIILPHTDNYYQKLYKTLDAVEKVYSELSEDVKIIWELRYLKPKASVGTWEEIANELKYSKTSLLRIREKYLFNIAQYIGYVEFDYEEPTDVASSTIKKERNVSIKTRFNVLKRDGFKCNYCGRNPHEDNVKLHVDHIQPLSKGGSNNIDNLVTACEECNIGKSNKELMR